MQINNTQKSHTSESRELELYEYILISTLNWKLKIYYVVYGKIKITNFEFINQDNLTWIWKNYMCYIFLMLIEREFSLQFITI